MIKIISFGEFKDKKLSDAYSDYIKRISKFHKIELVVLKEETSKTIIENLALEKHLIMKHVKNEYLIALDRQGNQLSSINFSNLINDKLSSFSNVTFIIGSSNGLHQDIIQKADKVISFSEMTFPHLLFRVILAEQIYRGFKIINNESYHK